MSDAGALVASTPASAASASWRAERHVERSFRPMGLWATLAWSAAAIAGLFSYAIVGTLMTWLGHPLATPVWFDVVPIGHMVMLAVVIVAVRTSGLPIRDYLALKPLSRRALWGAIGSGVAVFVGMMLLYQLTALIQQALGGAPIDMTGIVTAAGENTWMFLIAIWIAMLVAAPITEEIMHRGFMYRGLAESRLGVAGAVVLTSIVFGAGHAPGFGWQRVAVTALCGAVWAILRWRTGSTVAGIVSHATTNAIGAAMLTAMVLVAS